MSNNRSHRLSDPCSRKKCQIKSIHQDTICEVASISYAELYYPMLVTDVFQHEKSFRNPTHIYRNAYLEW